MIAFLLTVGIAIIYALIRAKHDLFLSHGKWKTYAFAEGVFIAISSTSLILWGTGMPWWNLFFIGPIFAFAFWIVFDCASGWLRTKNILYIGTQGLDLIVRNTVKGKLWRYLFWKLFVAAIITLGYFSCN